MMRNRYWIGLLGLLMVLVSGCTSGSTLDLCGGYCPAGYICSDDRCLPLEDGDLPVVDGDCPDGCERDTDADCGGYCPQGYVCTNDACVPDNLPDGDGDGDWDEERLDEEEVDADEYGELDFEKPADGDIIFIEREEEIWEDEQEDGDNEFDEELEPIDPCESVVPGQGQVCVPNPPEVGGYYLMDATEVTRLQYEAYLDALTDFSQADDPDCAWNEDPTPDYRDSWPISTEGDHPIVAIDWCDAKAYCAEKGKRLCHGSYDLHDEAAESEWYNACSRQGERTYPYGDTFAGSACNGVETGLRLTWSVGEQAACQGGYSGLYDLSGNVWEWTDACEGAGDGGYCLIRGGSFTDNFNGGNLRCEDFYIYDRDSRYYNLGFRCCSDEPVYADGDVDGDDESESAEFVEVAQPDCSCDEAGVCCDGCVPINEGGTCNDSDAATGDDRCLSGSCVGMTLACIGQSDLTGCADDLPATYATYCFDETCTGISLDCLGVACEGAYECCQDAYCAKDAGEQMGICRAGYALQGGGMDPTKIRYSSDGKLLASVGGGQVRIWETATWGLIRVLTGHAQRITDLAFSPDGSRIATAGADRSVRLWRVSDGGVERELLGHSEEVNAVAFSPDGAYLATGSYYYDAVDEINKGELWLWDLADGTVERTFDGLKGAVNDLAFSPDGTWIASAGKDPDLGGVVVIWQVADAQVLRSIPSHPDRVTSVAVSPDGSILASASVCGYYCVNTLKLWNVADGSSLRVIDAHVDELKDLTFSPDGTRIATAGYDYVIKVWRVADGGLDLSLFTSPQRAWAVAFDPNGSILVGARADNRIDLYRLADGEIERTVTGHAGRVNSLALDAGGFVLASASSDGAVKLWRVQDRKEIGHLPMDAGAVYTLGISPDDHWLVAGGKDGEIKLWRLGDGALWRDLDGLEDDVYAAAFSLMAHGWPPAVERGLFASGICPMALCWRMRLLFRVKFVP